MLTLLLAVALAAGPRLPAGADSAMTAALDSLGITPEQMNFDRHWMRGVALADSTVLRGLTDVHSLPEILADGLDALPVPRERAGGMEALLALLEAEAAAYSAAVDSLGASADSLFVLLPVAFADGDSPGEWDEPGALHRSWGLAAPKDPEVQADSLAGLLERWRGPCPLAPDTLIGLAMSLRGMTLPAAEASAPGVEGAVCAFDTSGAVPWVIGGPGPNVYSGGEYGLIVDPGGEDV